MRAALTIGLLIGITAGPTHADLPQRIACVANDTFWIWYGKGLQVAPANMAPSPGQRLVGSRPLEPEEQFRIQNGSLYFLDGFKKEYLYGPISEFAIGQARAGEWTIMFDSEFATATAVRVDQFHTRAYTYKCVLG